MIQRLAKWVYKNPPNPDDPRGRQQIGALCGAVGIGLNALLFAMKVVAGALSGSIAILSDAMNNLSDAGMSLITVFGFKIAQQKPDTEHPFGHGRMEYVAGLIVSVAILLMGFELLKTSVDRIAHPAPVTFGWPAAAILVGSILVKLYMAGYNRAVGRSIGSSAMRAASLDSLSDCLATAAALAAMLMSHWFGLSVDGWCGAAVAGFVLFAGVKAFRATIGPLLGQPPSPALIAQIEAIVHEQPEVIGVHDLIVHDYGPGRRMVSLHAEVPREGDILALHDAVDNIEKKLRGEIGCFAVIHMDPVVTDDAVAAETRARVAEVVKGIDERVTIHDFRMTTGPTHTNVIFDMVVPYDIRLTEREIKQRVYHMIRALDGSFYAVVEVDRANGDTPRKTP